MWNKNWNVSKTLVLWKISANPWINICYTLSLLLVDAFKWFSHLHLRVYNLMANYTDIHLKYMYLLQGNFKLFNMYIPLGIQQMYINRQYICEVASFSNAYSLPYSLCHVLLVHSTNYIQYNPSKVFLRMVVINYIND